jgi:hypothetical protein
MRPFRLSVLTLSQVGIAPSSLVLELSAVVSFSRKHTSKSKDIAEEWDHEKSYMESRGRHGPPSELRRLKCLGTSLVQPCIAEFGSTMKF